MKTFTQRVRLSDSGSIRFNIVLTLLFTIFFQLVQAQWSTQSPIPTNLDIRGTGVPSATRVFLATDDNSSDNGGALFESNDGGIHWLQRDIPVSLSSPFYGLFFLDGQHGWAYGNENYRTTDGGTTWDQLPLLGSTYFIEFYTPAFGLATSNFGLFVSYNGGMDWVESPGGIEVFDFRTQLDGLGASPNGIFRTSDGGVTFQSVYSGNASEVAYLSATLAVAIADGNFIRSTDGGTSWTAGSAALGRYRLTPVSGSVVLAWGRTGDYPDYDDRVLHSSDGGLTWNDLGEIVPAGINDFVVVNATSIVASDLEGNLYRSSDSGLNWSLTFDAPGQQTGYLSSSVPAFADAQTGYFGFGYGFVIKTTDGGQTWNQISSGSGNSLNDVVRLTNGNLIAAGENGTILRNGGNASWMLAEQLTPSHLKAIHLTDQNNLVAMAETGQVFLSSNGGNSWSAASGIPSDLSVAEDVHFINPAKGWVTGSGFNTSALFETNDGGETWTPVPGLLGAYVAIDAAGSDVWVANVSGSFFHSPDLGATWVQGEIPGSHQIRDMEFYNETTGYAVGMWGEAFRTDDGGLTWVILPTPNTTDDLTDIFLVGATELWVSTNNNKVYYSATSGQSWSVMEAGSAGMGYFNAVAASIEGNAWLVGQQGYIEYFTGPPSPPLNQPPVASFSFQANGLTVDFTDTSTDADGSITGWAWDFGDGTVSALQHPQHTYLTANTYVVSLTVTDDDGDTGNVFVIVVAQPGPGGTFGVFTEITPPDPLFVTPQDEDFWVMTTAPADYDNDGDLDVAVLGYYVVYEQSVEYRLVLLRNEGAASATEWEFSYFDVQLGDLTAGRSDMAWADADGDGDLDLAVGTNGFTALYRNDGGDLVQSGAELPGYWEDNSQAEFDLRSITWADFDNDGDPDLLIPSVFDFNNFTYHTALMRNDGISNNGDFIFVETGTGFPETAHAQSAWADADGDQDLDLLLANVAPLTGESFIRRYRNDGNGAFFAADILGNIAVEHGEAQWGDYDGDGDLDILLAGSIREEDGSFTHMALRIYRNDSETYVPVEVIADLAGEGWFDLTAATWADYDSDGDMDILVAGNYNSGSNIEGRARIYANQAGVFTDSGNELPAPRASGDRGGTFSWLDIDGDGDLDYFIAGQYFVPGGNGLVEAQMHLYRNDAPGVNLAPLAPSGLTANQQTGNGVLLSWLPGNDDHTPENALTYNLELYRDNVPVALPLRTPEPGNVSATTQWLLSELPEGNYKWILQAVDAAYIGSSTATGEFTIGEVTGLSDGQAPEGKSSLYQNYPNPFVSQTTITYELAVGEHVILNLCNNQGQELKVLVNGYQPKGRYVINLELNDLPPGIYHYSLKAGRFSQTKSLVRVHGTRQ